MYLRSDSAAGVRFLAAVKEGRGLKPSARAAGIGKETGYRWLRESYVMLRDQGLSLEAAQAEFGSFAAVVAWDEKRRGAPGDGRHHLQSRRPLRRVLALIQAGDTLDVARRAAGIGRSTAYRWRRARFLMLREQGLTARAAAVS